MFPARTRETTPEGGRAPQRPNPPRETQVDDPAFAGQVGGRREKVEGERVKLVDVSREGAGNHTRGRA